MFALLSQTAVVNSELNFTSFLSGIKASTFKTVAVRCNNNVGCQTILQATDTVMCGHSNRNISHHVVQAKMEASTEVSKQLTLTKII